MAEHSATPYSLIEERVISGNAIVVAVGMATWRAGKTADSIIITNWPESVPDDQEQREYYGGLVIAESLSKANRDMVIREHNSHASLVAALMVLEGAAYAEKLDETYPTIMAQVNSALSAAGE